MQCRVQSKVFVLFQVLESHKTIKTVAAQILTLRQKAEIAALAALPDERIDTADIPEVRDWTGAKRGVFYRPSKQSG